MSAQKLLLKIAEIKLQEIKDRLDKEVQQSTNKKSIANLFVNLLGEWMDKDNERDDKELLNQIYPDLGDLRKAYLQTLSELAKPTKVDMERLQATLDSGLDTTSIKEKVERKCERILLEAVDEDEVERAFRVCMAEKILRPEDEARADSILQDDELLKEYASLMTILFKHLDKWDWESPLRMRLHWVRNQRKFRGITCYEVENAILLQILACRWVKFLKPLLRQVYKDAVDMAKLRSGERPDKAVGFNQDQMDRHAAMEEARHSLRGYYWHMDDTATEEFFLKSLEGIEKNVDPYNRQAEGGMSNGEALLRQMLSCVTWLQAHGEVTGDVDNITVCVSDVENQCYSIPHDLIWAILRKLGFTERWVTFFKKVFTPRILVDGMTEPFKVQRGLLMAHGFTMILAETMLMTVDICAYKASGIHVLRNHDDIAIWDPSQDRVERAWEAWTRNLNALGLAWKKDRSGHVNIAVAKKEKYSSKYSKNWQPPAVTNAALPKWTPSKVLPTGPVKWHLVVLGADGHVRVDADYMATLNRELRIKLSQPKERASILGLVNAYNAHFLHVLKLLGPSTQNTAAWPYPQHASEICKVFKDQHMDPFGDGRGGFVGFIRKRIIETFPDVDPKVLTDAWFYWPIRAGGLAMVNPQLRAEQCMRAAKERAKAGGRRGGRTRSNPKRPENPPTGYEDFVKEQLEARRDSDSDSIVAAKHLPSDFRPEELPPNWVKITAYGVDKTIYFNKETEESRTEAPRWSGTYDYDDCVKHCKKIKEWHKSTAKWLDWRATNEFGPMGPESDDVLDKWCKDFSDRSKSWQGAGNTGETSKLGPYYREVLKRFATSLLDVFGEFGMIPPDLVPHALIWHVVRSLGKSGDNGEDWVDVGAKE